MIVKENITVYQCDFCKKKMFKKKAMENHIQWCAKNPENYKACSFCNHIEETTIEYWRESYYGGGDESRTAKAFRCKKLDKLLYPLKVEKKGLPEKWFDTFENQEPMPKVCEHATYGDRITEPCSE